MTTLRRISLRLRHCCCFGAVSRDNKSGKKTLHILTEHWNKRANVKVNNGFVI